MNLFETSVKETIDRYTMILPGEKVIVGLSGGADSISLINVLKKLDYDVIAVHINHMIRGEEAQRDENFVISFCNKNKNAGKCTDNHTSFRYKTWRCCAL